MNTLNDSADASNNTTSELQLQLLELLEEDDEIRIEVSAETGSVGVWLDAIATVSES